MVDPEGTVGPPSNQTSADCGQIPDSAKIFFILVYSLVFLVGLTLNGFTLKVYFCSPQQKVSQSPGKSANSVTIFLKNLAAADFLMSLFLPMRISRFISSFAPMFRVYCNFGASVFYLNMYASILFMGFIAVNRYLKIVHHSKNHVLQTPRAARIISAVTWVFLLTTTAAYITLKLLTQEPAHPSVIDTVSCSTRLNKNLLYKIIQIYSAAIFLLVLVSLLFFYYSTSRKLATHQQNQQASSDSKKLVKSRRNMLVLVCVFCVCFVPYHLVRLLYTFLKGRCLWGQALFYLKEVTVMLSSLNVCLDPLIYFLFSKQYRAQMQRSLKRRGRDETGRELANQQRVDSSES